MTVHWSPGQNFKKANATMFKGQNFSIKVRALTYLQVAKLKKIAKYDTSSG